MMKKPKISDFTQRVNLSGYEKALEKWGDEVLKKGLEWMYDNKALQKKVKELEEGNFTWNKLTEELESKKQQVEELKDLLRDAVHWGGNPSVCEPIDWEERRGELLNKKDDGY